MSSIFPIRETVTLDSEREPRLVDLDEETADEVFEALASRTTRKIFLALHETPQTASDLAKETDTTVQNAQYHLEKLVDAELIEIVDTWYSERGSEMKVYAPKDESLVLFAGRDKQHSLRRLVNRFVGVFSLLVPSSALVGLAAHWRQTTAGVASDDAAADDDVATEDVAIATDDDAADAPDADGADTDDALDDGVDTDDAPDVEEDSEMGAFDEGPEESPDDADVEDSYTTTDNETEVSEALENDSEFHVNATGDGGVDTTASDSVSNNATDAAEIAEAAAGIDPIFAAGLFFFGGLFIFGALTLWYG